MESSAGRVPAAAMTAAAVVLLPPKHDASELSPKSLHNGVSSAQSEAMPIGWFDMKWLLSSCASNGTLAPPHVKIRRIARCAGGVKPRRHRIARELEWSTTRVPPRRCGPHSSSRLLGCPRGGAVHTDSASIRPGVDAGRKMGNGMADARTALLKILARIRPEIWEIIGGGPRGDVFGPLPDPSRA